MIGNVLHLAGKWLAQQAFYFFQIASVFDAAERNGVAVCASPGGSPDAVYVSVGLYR
jgi:hypothetical protein